MDAEALINRTGIQRLRAETDDEHVMRVCETALRLMDFHQRVAALPEWWRGYSRVNEDCGASVNAFWTGRCAEELEAAIGK